MVFDEALGKSNAHHPYSQEDKRQFSCERVVVYLERFDRTDLRKLLIGGEWTPACWKGAEASKIREFLLCEPLHVRYHFVHNSVLQHAFVRHVGRYIGGVRGIARKQIPSSIRQPELINQLPTLDTITLFDRGSELVQVRRDTIMQRQSLIGFRAISGTKFIVHVGNGGGDLVLPFYRLNRRFGAQRNQDAEHDDRHFTNELAPAVQRLRQVEMHGPPLKSEG